MGLVFSHSLATSSHHIKEVWIKDNGEEVLDEFRGERVGWDQSMFCQC